MIQYHCHSFDENIIKSVGQDFKELVPLIEFVYGLLGGASVATYVGYASGAP